MSISLVESLMREVKEHGCVRDAYQSEELLGCLAVLHAKKREWDDFQTLTQHIISPGILINILIEAFAPAERQLKEDSDSSGINYLLQCSGEILSLPDKKIPEEGAFLVHKCFEHQAIIKEMNDEALKAALSKNKLSLPQAMWDTLGEIKSYLFIDAEGECTQFKLIDDISPDDEDTDPIELSSVMAESLTQILENLPYLHSASPVDAQMFMADFLSLIEKLPSWAEFQIKEREKDEKLESAREEFVTENLSLLSTLVDCAREFTAQGKFDKALLTLQATLKMIPDETSEIDGQEVLHHMLGRIDLLASLMYEENKSTEVKEFHAEVISRINLIIDALPGHDLVYHAEFFSHFASGMDLTWKCIQSIKESYGLPCDDNSILTELNCVYLTHERIERLFNEQQIALYINEELHTDNNASSRPSLLEPLTTICHRMSAFCEYLGYPEQSLEFRNKFKLLTLRLIKSSGISFTEEMDENGPTTNYLDFFEELVYRGDLEGAQQLAQGFYSCYFEFDSSTKQRHFQELDPSDDDYFDGPSDRGILKRFMILCGEAGFASMAIDIYRKLNARILDPEFKFLNLVDLLNSLRV